MGIYPDLSGTGWAGAGVRDVGQHGREPVSGTPDGMGEMGGY